MTPHILVVEDEAALVELLRYNLEEEGFRVSAAADGEAALAAVAEDKPDLTVPDLILPPSPGLHELEPVPGRESCHGPWV